MSDFKSRPPALLAIIIYKCFTIGLLLFVAIGLFTTSKKYDDLFAFAEEYMTVGKREIIKGGLAQVLSVSTTKMQFGAVVAVIYAVVNGLEAFGLWHQQAWATIMVAGIVGLTIPIEIFEIFHHVSGVKIGIFMINLAMFIYLLRHALEERTKRLEGKG